MIDAIRQKQGEVEALCRRHRVRRLFLFGSGAGPDFDPARSDLDFLVVFKDQDRKGFDDVFFLLRTDLELLFGRGVDLVEARSVKNPYFIASINRTKRMLYAA